MSEQRMRGHISLTNGIDKTFATGQILLLTNPRGSWISLADYNGPIRDVDTSNPDVTAAMIEAAQEAFHWAPVKRLKAI